ncbi:MAG TPA: glycosyltransferase family 1 protein [Candidatus Saccharimonadales bacterium]|nr:glycosyltransferase family 1 protein [Candidatus Saccharimonadales bacterium]
MKIGVDLRPLQTGHKFRGIGEVAKQTTDRIIKLAYEDKNNDISFVFYEYDGEDPKQLLNIPKGLKYEVVKLGVAPENDTSATKADKVRRTLKHFYGAPIDGSEKSDIFLQFDYAFGVPTNTKTMLVKHDLIPYLFWDKYFESAWVPFKNKALRSTLRTIFANHKFMHTLRRSLRNAHVIMSVSESTKNDIEKYFGVDPKKSKVALLGVDVKPSKTNDVSKVDEKKLPTKPYIMFVGAGDARRRIDDAVAAFNNLKASGRDIQLVLVGENFKSPTDIPNVAVRNAVLSSSYKKDILTLGYVDDETKQRLYKDAIAYVYPTKYEGFGIPILESMLLECPVIVYKNSSTGEVGGDYAIYAKDWNDIKTKVENLMDEPKEVKQKRALAAKKHAEQFTWDKTADVLYQELVSVK